MATEETGRAALIEPWGAWPDSNIVRGCLEALPLRSEEVQKTTFIVPEPTFLARYYPMSFCFLCSSFGFGFQGHSFKGTLLSMESLEYLETAF